MDAFTEFEVVAAKLEKRQIPYALIGGVAMAYHGYVRHTEDIDILITEDELVPARKVVEECGFWESADPWTFSTTQIRLHRFLKVLPDFDLLLDLMVAQQEWHADIVANAEIATLHGLDIHVARASDIIRLKQGRNSPKDREDIRYLRDDKGS